MALKHPGETLETFRRNNILLFDTKTLPLTWSLDSPTEIGNVDIVREVQGFCFLSSLQNFSNGLYYLRPSTAQLQGDKGPHSCERILT